MKAYKGFKRHNDGTLWCRDFQYESGKTYKHKGNIELFKSGFHACHELHQVWCFYPNNGENVFWEVECGGDVIESKIDSGKLVCSEITLVKEVDMNNIALFDIAWNFFEGFAKVKLLGKYNFINTEGKILSEMWFDYAEEFSDGFARVEFDGKYNLINTEGKLLSDQWFDDVSYFFKGFATIWLDGNVKRINKKGKIIQ